MPATAPGPGASRARTRRDRCPGVLRPWPADDGALVRLRLPGGEITAGTLAALADVAEAYGDGRVRFTSRANVQLRGLASRTGADEAPAPAPSSVRPGEGRAGPEEHGLEDADARREYALEPAAHAALLATGLVPASQHERVRNVMASPLTGIAGGLADLRPLVRDLDDALCSDPVLAALPGRFLFVLDDGRGDLVDRTRDLGVLARDASHGQLLLGSHGWGPVLPLGEVPTVLADLARGFLTARGDGDDAPWHVDELPPTAEGEPPWHHPYATGPPPGAYAGGGDPQKPGPVSRSDIRGVKVSDRDMPAPLPDVATGHFVEPDVATGHSPTSPGDEPLADGPVAPGWVHHVRPDGLDRADIAALTAGLATDTRMVVTPWRGVLVPTPDGTR